MISLEVMFKSAKTAKCKRCDAPIPECDYELNEGCTLPGGDQDSEMEPCHAKLADVRCPLALCYNCRLALRGQVELLKRMDAVLDAEAEEMLKRPYARSFIQEPDGRFSTSMPELPGCISCGGFPNNLILTDAASLYDAYQSLQEAAIGWVAATIENGEDIPKPEAED